MSFVLSCQFSTSYWYQIITFQLINFPFRKTWKTSLQCFLTKCYFCCNIYKTNYIVWFEHVLIEDDRMYVQIWWNFIFVSPGSMFLFGLYFEEGIRQMWKCQKSNLSSLFRSHKTCRRLEKMFVWQNGKIYTIAAFQYCPGCVWWSKCLGSIMSLAEMYMCRMFTKLRARLYCK